MAMRPPFFKIRQANSVELVSDAFFSAANL
jgi:hypothetical protein